MQDKKTFPKKMILIGIPDPETYVQLLDIFCDNGNEVDSYSIKDFEYFPHIFRWTGSVYVTGEDTCSDYETVEYEKFIREYMGGSDTWREKLSEEFNKKIKSYDEQRVDSQG